MMNNKNSFDFVRDAMSYDDFERLTRQAYAERDAAIGRALRGLFLAFAVGLGKLLDAIDLALELRSLATLEDRQLALLGLERSDLPGFVYGWQKTRTDVLNLEFEAGPARPYRIAA